MKSIMPLRARLRRHVLGELLVGLVDSKFQALVFGAVIGGLLQRWLARDSHSFFEWVAAAVILEAIYLALKLRRERGLQAKTRLETREIMRPNPEAESLVKSANLSRSVVGNVIELFVHPNLTTLKMLTKLGWAPSEVSFSLPPTAVRTFDNVLRLVGGVNASLSKPNGTKLGLARSSFISFDSDDSLEFEFYLTDYFTQQSVYRVLPNNPTLRRELANLDPEMNQAPNSMALQAIVLFSTGAVLCMLRSHLMDAEGGRWSISFEEQLQETDFEVPGVPPAEYFFRRAFIEEVFGCQGTSIAQILDTWNRCKGFLTTYRLWGLFFEEEVSHFQMLGFYWLNITPAELVSHHAEAKAKGWAGVDLEGKMFVLERDQVDLLLEKGEATVVGLYDGATRPIRVQQLHRTSLYRLWRLRLSLDRKTAHGLTTLNLRKN